MSIKDLIQSALSGSASKFEEAFSSVMSEKMENAVGAKYDEMFDEEKSKYRDDDGEEEEDDDEEDDEDDD